MWKKELEKIQCQSFVGSQVITGMPFGYGTSDKVASYACDIAEIVKIIDGLLTQIQYQRKRIIDYIGSIQDSWIRQIVYYRCVSCMSWREVANSMGGNNTENGVKKAYSRFISTK